MGSRSASSQTARASSPLGRWGRTQKRGWLTRLHEATARPGIPPVALTTLDRLSRGLNVNLVTAKRVSRETGIPYELLTDERDALEERVA